VGEKGGGLRGSASGLRTKCGNRLIAGVSMDENDIGREKGVTAAIALSCKGRIPQKNERSLSQPIRRKRKRGKNSERGRISKRFPSGTSYTPFERKGQV